MEIHDILREDLWDYSRIQVHAGKTQIWNRGEHIPTNHDTLLRAAQVEDPEAQIWFGNLEAPAEERGIKVLGTPLGTAAFVKSRLQSTVEHHRLLLDRIPAIQDLQSAWLLLLFCASSRATYHLRVCHPEFAAPFARQHPDVGMSGHASRSHSTPVIMGVGQSSDAHGGIGPFAVRPALPARHFGVLGLIVSTLWLNVMRTLPARWQRLSVLRQLTQSTSEEQWQAVANLPRLGTTVQIGRLYLKERALVNRTLMRWIPGCPLMGGSSSQPRPWHNVTGPLSCGRVFPRPNKPSSARNRVPCRGCPSLLFPLRSPLGSLLSSSASCFFVASGLPSLSLLALAGVAVHSASLATTVQRVRERESWGVGGSLWRAQRHGSAVKPELGTPPISSSGIWTFLLPTMTPVVWRSLPDGLPLFGGAQLAIDTTLVSSVQADGRPRPQCARVDGAALSEAHRRKQRTYPEVSGTQGRARLVVLAAEVGGRWSDEARAFVSQLAKAKAKARAVPRVLAGRARQAWQHRWSSILACAAARAFALSLLDKRPALGSDGDTLSSSDVVAACRHLPLGSTL